jgi:hypothetical protein
MTNDWCARAEFGAYTKTKRFVEAEPNPMPRVLRCAPTGYRIRIDGRSRTCL